jgi:hypothetical protein
MTQYDVEIFLRVLEANLNEELDRPKPIVIQSYSNSFVKQASGLSILFFKDFSGVSPIRKKELFEKYSRSKFAKETGWDKLMMIYHEYIIHKNRLDS